MRDNETDISFDNLRNFCQFFEIDPEKACGFKTIFPLYFSKNERIKREIETSTSLIEELQLNLNDELKFSSHETLGILVNVTYQQEMTIAYKEPAQCHSDKKKQNPLILDKKGLEEEDEEQKLSVRHYVRIVGIRFLFNKETKEKLNHHLVKSFKYKKFRKTDFIEVETRKSLLQDWEYTFSKIGRAHV